MSNAQELIIKLSDKTIILNIIESFSKIKYFLSIQEILKEQNLNMVFKEF